MNQYRYRIKALNATSERFGNCEVCNKPVVQVHYQVEEQRYSEGWTHYKCKNLFGHRECLEASRREPVAA